MESPEFKRAKTEYLKNLYHGNKQQAEVEMEDKVVVAVAEAEIQTKKFEDIWSNAKQSEVEMEEKVVVAMAEAEIQKKKFEDIWHNANMLEDVAPNPVIAEAITDTPDALLPMIKMDPETFHMPTLNSVAQKWFDSTPSTVISFESKKNDDDDDDDDDPEDDTPRKNGKSKAASAKKKKGGKTQKDSNDEDNADDEDDEGSGRSAGGAASRTKKSQRKKNVTIVHLEKYGIELPESTKKLIEKSREKYICCANGHRMQAGPFVDTNKRSKTAGKQKNLNSKTKPADGS